MGAGAAMEVVDVEDAAALVGSIGGLICISRGRGNHRKGRSTFWRRVAPIDLKKVPRKD